MKVVSEAQERSREKNIIHQASTACQRAPAIPEVGKPWQNARLVLFSRRAPWDMHGKSQVTLVVSLGLGEVAWRVISWGSGT